VENLLDKHSRNKIPNNKPLCLGFGAWCLGFVCYLVLGIWNFVEAAGGNSIEYYILQRGEDSIKNQSYIIINQIFIEGNKKTKANIISRELNLNSGDTIPLADLLITLGKCRNQILNTRLFTQVTINLKNWDQNKTDIHIIVEERWYTFPIPIFELADRNFNVWWVDENHSFARTDYGVRFYQKNIRGKNQELKLVAQFGFTEKFELFYTIPYFDKRQINGVKVWLSFSRNKQINYINDIENKQVFHEDPDFIRQRFYSGLTFSHRKAIHNSHFLDIKYHSNQIGDTIAGLNADYFLDSSTSQKYIQLKYIFESDHRDVKSYPLKGSFTKLAISKSIGDVNIFSIMATNAAYFPLGSKMYLSALVKTKLSTPQQSFFNQRGFGYSQNFVRGYEYYVVDGQNYILFKSVLKRQLFSKESIVPLLPIEKFRTIPLSVYLKAYVDMGYMDKNPYNPSSTLNEQLLLGWGMGIDVASYYDFILRIEYSVNKLWEKGLFLHFELEL